MKVVIMAGGKGSRVASLAKEVPKPMLPMCGMPILEYEIACLKEQGLTDIMITVSHMKEIIMDYFGDGSLQSPVTKQSFGVHISYFVEEEPLGNAGALFRIKDFLGQDDFLLINADVVFEVDFSRMLAAHKKSGAQATILTHPNSHPYDSGLIIEDEKGFVTKWLTKEDERPIYYKNCVNAGLHILHPSVLEGHEMMPKVDLDRDILRPLAATGKLYSYHSPEYCRDMGTPKRYRAVCQDLEQGIVRAKSLRQEQKAIFLDRDGTINRYVGFLSGIDDFSLLDGVSEAIAKINASGYLCIVVTNQPVVARGELSFAGLQKIHEKMETLLGEAHAYIDALYVCPHHPDKGFMGEIRELKVQCDCRKPKPGMLLQAAKDYRIDLAKSWMIGDSKADIQAGRAAGCHTVLLKREEDKAGEDFGQEYLADNLQSAVGYIIKDR